MTLYLCIKCQFGSIVGVFVSLKDEDTFLCTKIERDFISKIGAGCSAPVACNAVKNASDIVSYSMKTNFEVGKVLEEITDCNFSVHSIESLKLIKNKKRVWFFGQAWNDKELNYLFQIDEQLIHHEKNLKNNPS